MLRRMVALPRSLRRAVAPALLAAVLAGAAAARDYVVVASSEAAIVKGQSVDSGQKLAVAPGHTVTLMHASGVLVTLKGAPGGVMAPSRKTADADSARLEVLRTMVAPPPKAVSEGLGATRRTRGGVCPTAEMLTSLDAIAQVQASGCTAQAAQALDAWIAAQPAPEE